MCIIQLRAEEDILTNKSTSRQMCIIQLKVEEDILKKQKTLLYMPQSFRID